MAESVVYQRIVSSGVASIVEIDDSDISESDLQ